MRFISILLAVSILYNCTGSPKQETTNQNLGLVSTGITKQFKLDSLASYLSDHLVTYSEGGKRFLVRKQHETNDIVFYDFNTAVEIHRMHIEEDGRHAIGQFGGFHILSLDSVLVSKHGQTELCLLNRDGEILDRYNYALPLDSEQQAQVATISNSFDSPIVRIGKYLYIPQRKAGYTGDQTHEDLNVFKVYLTYNLETRKSKLLPLTYFKERLTENVPPLGNYYAQFNGNEFVFLFEFESAFYTSPDLKSHTTHKIAGLQTQRLTQLPAEKDMFLQCKWSFENSYYIGFHYDKYRDVYYRLKTIPIEITTQTNLSKFIRYQPTFQVEVISADFKLINSVVLPEGKYVPQNSFVEEEGLFICTNHVDNPDMDEDYLSYEAFVPEL